MCDKCGCGENHELSFEEKVKEIITEIRPMLQSHGGDIEFVALDSNIVKVKLRGACSGCPSAQITIKQGVERMLKEKLPLIKEVIAVN